MPLAVDLCCGLGGWSEGLRAAGWDVIGFDIVRFAYPYQLVIQDIRFLSGLPMRGEVSLIVASPPCLEFSRHDQPWTRAKNPPFPHDGIELVEHCFRIAREAACPLILENVRGAQRFIGPARAHWGSYYLWGDVPALLPPYQRKDWKQKKTTLWPKHNRPALRAKIPPPLSRFIGEVFA